MLKDLFENGCSEFYRIFFKLPAGGAPDCQLNWQKKMKIKTFCSFEIKKCIIFSFNWFFGEKKKNRKLCATGPKKIKRWSPAELTVVDKSSKFSFKYLFNQIFGVKFWCKNRLTNSNLRKPRAAIVSFFLLILLSTDEELIISENNRSFSCNNEIKMSF